MKVSSDCGAANFLAALSGRRPNEVKSILGLPVNLPRRYKAICSKCGQPMLGTKRSVCWKCYRKYHMWISVACSECGNSFLRRSSQIIWRANHPWALTGKTQKYIFCSRRCHGILLAKTHGFIVHPENIGLGGGNKKWDYLKVYQLQDKTGWGRDRISRALGIPAPTVSGILAKRKP